MKDVASRMLSPQLNSTFVKCALARKKAQFMVILMQWRTLTKIRMMSMITIPNAVMQIKNDDSDGCFGSNAFDERSELFLTVPIGTT